MNGTSFTYLLEHPEAITVEQTNEMKNLIDEFPYFQSARALYLKGLKNQDSFSYNKALKITAAHTTDRHILFDYITSPLFSQNEASIQIKHQEKYLSNIRVSGAEDVSIKVNKEELQKAENILNPNLFIAKKDSLMTFQTQETILEVGKPLDFDKQETHSFSEWLKLSVFKPIERSEKSKEEDVNKESMVANGTLSRKRKEEIINSFIETNPKIRVSTSKTVVQKQFSETDAVPSEALMTETLARVYLEQKNYKKARLAFKFEISRKKWFLCRPNSGNTRIRRI